MNKTEILSQCQLPDHIKRSVARMRLWTFQTQPNKLSLKASRELESQGWELVDYDIPQGRKVVSLWRKRA